MKSSTTVKKVVGYARVSTKAQVSKNSLEYQCQTIQTYADTNNAVVLEIIQEQASGSKNDRTGVMRAIELARHNNATLVIAYLDRLSRDVIFLMELKASKLDFVALDMPDLNTMTLGIMAVWAQYQREQIQAKVKGGLVVAQQKRRNVGGVRMCKDGSGLTNVEKARVKSGESKKRKAIKMNADYEKAIRRLLIEKGLSYRATAQELTALGIKTTKGADVWSAAQVSRLAKMFGIEKAPGKK